MYFSIIGMLTIVMGLISLTFSYYVPSSRNMIAQVDVMNIDNILKSDDLQDGSLSLKPYESRTITFYVISNNNYETHYRITYDDIPKVEVTPLSLSSNAIDAHDVHRVEVLVQNAGAERITINFSLVNNY